MIQLTGLGELVDELSVTIPGVRLSGIDRGAEAIQDALKRAGWVATVIPVNQTTGSPKLRVERLSKASGSGRTTVFGPDGRIQTVAGTVMPFDRVDGMRAISAAAGSLGVRLSAFKEWLVKSSKSAASTVKEFNPVSATITAGKLIKKKADEGLDLFSKCKAEGKWFCALRALGIPAWVPYVAIGLAGLVILVQITKIKTGLLSGLSGYKGKKRSHRQ